MVLEYFYSWEFYNKPKQISYKINCNWKLLMLNKPQKIIMLGESSKVSLKIIDVGKTAILQTFINKKFPEKTTPTFGSSFHRHTFIDA